MSSTVNALRTVILYASSDAELLHEFQQHLTTLTKEKLIETWSLDNVSPGADQDRALEQALDECDIIVLLLSASFTADCWYLIDRALDHSTTRGVHVVPVRVRPIDLGYTPIGTMRTLPDGSLAVSQYASRDDAWVWIVRELRQLAHTALGIAATALGQIGTIVEFDSTDALGWIALDEGGRVRFGGTSLPREGGIAWVATGVRVEVRGTALGYKGVPRAVAVVPLIKPGPAEGSLGTVDEMLTVRHRIRVIENFAKADARIRRLEHHTIKALHKAAIRLRLDRRVLLGGISAQFVATLPLYADPASQMLADLHELNAAPALADDSTPLLAWLDNACILSECRSEFSLFSAVRQDLSRGKSGSHPAVPPRSPLGSGTNSAPRENEQIKYYIYVSSTKVRMLYDQVPRSVSQGHAVTGKLSLFSKATLVCDHLRTSSLVGTVADGRAYFYGSLAMNWGVIREYAAEIVFFGGDSAGTLVALVGSVNSLVGSPRTAVESGHHLDYYLFRFFTAIEERPEPSWLELNTEVRTAIGSTYGDRGIQSFNHFMARVPHEAQRVEFVARAIVSHDDNGRRLVIGSPIYVALGDNAL